MNIFVLDSDPIIAAQHACDKHIVKMILESAQLLCSCFEQGKAPYKRTHYNHPSSKWSRASRQNYDWLIRHGLALCDEYTFRYGKVHKSRAVIEWCRDNSPQLPGIGLTQFAQAMPDEYKNTDAVKAYRAYYIGAKSKMLIYTKRAPPMWLPKELVKKR